MSRRPQQTRLLKEYNALMQEGEHETWLLPSAEDDMDRWLALIPGAPGTPYAYGLFHFELVMTDYPFSPPTVTHRTTSGNTVRFNPNLYDSGKVCLSILGTFHGEAWSPEYTLQKTLVNIKACVLTEHPIRNEPAFESLPLAQCMPYSVMVQEHVFRVAIIEVMEDSLAEAEARNGAWTIFSRERITHFMRHFENITCEVDAFEARRSAQTGRDTLQDVSTGVTYKPMSASDIKARLEAIHAKLMFIFTRPELYDTHVGKFTPTKAHDDAWNGVPLEIEMHLPKHSQSNPPLVRFPSSVYHPNVSTGGVPYMDLKRKPTWTAAEVVEAVHDLISSEPNVRDYTTWLNPAACERCTKAPAEYAGTVRRYVSRIVQEEQLHQPHFHAGAPASAPVFE